MAMLRIKIDAERLLDELRTTRERVIPECRRRLLDKLIRIALQTTVFANPVDTARSRSSWVGAMEQLGIATAPGWEGSDSSPSAIREGKTLSAVSRDETEEASEVQVRNGVEYIAYLEYGTQRMSPFQMVRIGLIKARDAIR